MQNQSCTCLWTPCRCDYISGLTPHERIKQQEHLVDLFWQRRPKRLLERKEAERQQMLAQKATERRGIDNLTTDERDTPRTTSRIPQHENRNPNIIKSREARRSACVYCGVNDGKTERLEGTILHRNFCRSAWMKDQGLRDAAAARLNAEVNSSWKGFRT
jgi:hypothetical protein